MWILHLLQHFGSCLHCNTLTRKYILYKWWVAALFIIPLLSIYVVITEEQRHWLWSAITPLSDAAGAPLVFTHSWWWSISTAYFYLQLLIGIFVLIRRMISLPRSVGSRALLLLIGVLPPVICYLLYQTQLFPDNSLPILMMVGLAVSGMIYFWGIYYFELLEHSSLSRDVIIDNMSEGVIVLDRKDQIFNINTTALNMLGLNQRSATKKNSE